ncbi:MAG TPA: DUF11 domain-containing protein [Candidatus Saccharimonadales bacterium]
MKAKLIGLVVGLLSAATIGVVQLQAEAAGDKSGQVGSAPICEVSPIGNRGNTGVDLTTQNRPNLAYSVKDSVATVEFKVKGPKNCKVRVTNNAFWAPAQNGKPWNKQILFPGKVTKVYTPGTYESKVNLPKQPKKGMCYYQVDLTYGSSNVTPVIAYGHGKIQGCIKTPPTPPKKPGVSINKLVEGVDYLKVGVNVEYEYQIAVKNTGEVDLTNVAVTDTPEAGVTLISASAGTVASNKWTHTIPKLSIGETMSFTIKAKVPEYQAGRITNTVCVDAPQVPGNPDDCDDADVEVEKPGKVLVCDPETSKTIFVDEKDADKYPKPGSAECEEVIVCDPDTGDLIKVPATKKDQYESKNSDACKESEPVKEVKALPETGPAEALLQLIGAGSLTGSTAYYVASRRKL